MKTFDYSFSQIWFALALVLTTATQLRWGGLPIGPGELMLVVWLIATGLQIIKQRRITLSLPLKLFIAFWSVVLILLFAGWLVGLFQGVFDVRAGTHNLLAYLFVCLITLTAITYWNSEQAITIGKLVLFFVVLALIPLWIYGQFFNEIGSLNIWYGGSRFLGWAVDPNQTAILTVPLPFMALYYYRQSSKFKHKMLCIVLLFGSIILGIGTDSDSLKVAWVGAIVVYFILTLLARGQLTHLKVVIALAIILLICSIGLFVFGAKIYASVEQMYYLGNQGPVRLALWANGIQATSNSPLVGFGPGAYSGVQEPFSGSECHNTFIDWMTNTGVAGFLILFFLLTFIFIKAITSSNNQEVVAVLTTLIIVSLFLYVIRHPVWWFYLLWVISLISFRKEKRNRTYF
jgi:O-antigen ligase